MFLDGNKIPLNLQV